MEDKTQIIDVVVIGAGVAGCCVARQLSEYQLSIVVLEAGSDIATGATRANSGIVHAGFDPLPNTDKARFNVEGARLYPKLAEELGFLYVNNGSLVLAYTPEEIETVKQLVQRGIQNGVEEVRFVDADELHALEPNCSPEALGALYAPTAGIVDPYAVAQAHLENALHNGAEVFLQCGVKQVQKTPEGFTLLCANDKEFHAKTVVNAAGIYADTFNNQVSSNNFTLIPRRGDYCIFDNNLPNTVSHTLFSAPSKVGKGVLVSPTVHGNLLVGPSAMQQESKDSLATITADLTAILQKGRHTWPKLNTRAIITNFAGIRASCEGGDFIVGEAPDALGFFNIAGFDSPGLSSAPAVALYTAKLVAAHCTAPKKDSFSSKRTGQFLFAMAQNNPCTVAQLVESNPLHGNLVCRCCNVSEADIVTALHGNVPVLCLDTLKWRVGAMMGRCHAGFCTPEILKIFVRETGMLPSEVEKRLPHSAIIASARPDYSQLAQLAAPKLLGKPKEVHYDVVVAGGGAAGIAAATSASNAGAQKVLLIDREQKLGGILKQCIHNGFGLHRYKEELTGPEYATHECEEMQQSEVECLGASSVLNVSTNEQGLHTVLLVNDSGCFSVEAVSVVLATGSRERGLGALNIAGDRPSGIFSAGSAQNLMNLQGCMPGKNVVILGSGDIGLIMARRCITQGANVLGVFEIMPHPSGLRRNIVQCLDDYKIPLHLSTTVVGIEGQGRLQAVVVQQVSADTLQPIEGTQQRIECDTLLLSVGLLPENEVAKTAEVELDVVTGGALVDNTLQTSIPGVFACGNALHVHDLADYASEEGMIAGKQAALYNTEKNRNDLRIIPVKAAKDVRYVVPQFLRYSPITGQSETHTLSFRVSCSVKHPNFFIEGIRGDTSTETIKQIKAMVAVPAEMIRINMRASDVSGFEQIRVRVQAAEDEE